MESYWGRGLLFHFTVTRPVLLHCPKHSKALVLNQKWMSELPGRLSKSSFLQNSSLLREKEGRIWVRNQNDRFRIGPGQKHIYFKSIQGNVATDPSPPFNVYLKPLASRRNLILVCKAPIKRKNWTKNYLNRTMKISQIKYSFSFF